MNKITNEKITLEQYKAKVKIFWKDLETLLVDAKDDEVYQVYNICRTDFQSKFDLEYSGVFKKYKSIYELIHRADDNNMEQLDDEDIDICEVYYWTINKYRIIKGEYERIFSLHQVDFSGYLDIEFSHKISEIGNEDEISVYQKWEKLNFAKGANVVFPFNCGDIIKLPNKLFSKTSEYFVYHKEDAVFKRNQFGELSYGSIFRSGSPYGFRSFVPCHIKKIEP